MNSEENDPDELQLLDETDTEWVNLWRKAINKKRSTTKDTTLDCSIPKSKPANKTQDLDLRKIR